MNKWILYGAALTGAAIIFTAGYSWAMPPMEAAPIHFPLKMQGDWCTIDEDYNWEDDGPAIYKREYRDSDDNLQCKRLNYMGVREDHVDINHPIDSANGVCIDTVVGRINKDVYIVSVSCDYAEPHCCTYEVWQLYEGYLILWSSREQYRRKKGYVDKFLPHDKGNKKTGG